LDQSLAGILKKPAFHSFERQQEHMAVDDIAETKVTLFSTFHKKDLIS